VIHKIRQKPVILTLVVPLLLLNGMQLLLHERSSLCWPEWLLSAIMLKFTLWRHLSTFSWTITSLWIRTSIGEMSNLATRKTLNICCRTLAFFMTSPAALTINKILLLAVSTILTTLIDASLPFDELSIKR
jgi:hypothetical protein